MSELKQVPKTVVSPSHITHRYVCNICFDTGALMAKSLEYDTGPFVFMCTCRAGEQSRRAYPSWNSVSPNRYEVIKG